MFDGLGLASPDESALVGGVDSIAGINELNPEMQAGFPEPDGGGRMNWMSEPLVPGQTSTLPPLSPKPAGPVGPANAPRVLPGPIYPGAGWHVGPAVSYSPLSGVAGDGFGSPTTDESWVKSNAWAIAAHVTSLFLGYQLGQVYGDKLGMSETMAPVVTALGVDVATYVGSTAAFEAFGYTPEQKKKFLMGLAAVGGLVGLAFAFDAPRRASIDAFSI